MGIKSLSTLLKKEEVQLPVIFGESEYPEIRGRNNYVHPKEETRDDIMDEFDGFNFKMDVDVDDDDDDAENIPESQLNYWECLKPWDGFCNSTIEDGKAYDPNNNFLESSSWMYFEEESIKKEEPEYAFLEDDEKKKSLNLSLNYQEVLDAWSDRTLWADDSSFLTPNNAHMEDEVQVIEEERKEREARVLRYKEKRQTRLFSKKIRYQVRKLNAEKRPRLKGRFVKRVAEKMHK